MEGEAARAYLAALRMLGRRAFSVEEVRRRLLRRGLPAEAVAEAVAKLAAEGALDDAAYARAYVHDRLLFHPVGRRGLRVELQRRGVPPEAAEEALATLDPAREEQLVRSLIERRSDGRVELTAETRLRLRAWLLRRGFTPEAVRRALGGFFEGGEDEP
jgi:regulatory protein